jgi:hypothetical protein
VRSKSRLGDRPAAQSCVVVPEALVYTPPSRRDGGRSRLTVRASKQRVQVGLPRMPRPPPGQNVMMKNFRRPGRAPRGPRLNVPSRPTRAIWSRPAMFCRRATLGGPSPRSGPLLLLGHFTLARSPMRGGSPDPPRSRWPRHATETRWVGRPTAQRELQPRVKCSSLSQLNLWHPHN